MSDELMNTDHIQRKRLDLSYGSESESQKLDIYWPENGDGPFPVIMAVHGGAFMMGDKADTQLKPMLEGLKRQYAVVSVNYRLSGEAIFPAQIQDVKAAIWWIKANAQLYQLDASRIALWGGSAGGNLVSLAGTSAHHKFFEDTGNTAFPCDVQVVVDWFGPTDFLSMDELFEQSGVKGLQIHNAADSAESILLGSTITEVPDKVKAANPETYISKQSPPFFIQHGTKDLIIPTQQSVIFYNKLVDMIGNENVRLELLEGAGHGGPEFETEENVNKVLDFIDKFL
ncbi:alpha/beta hydrolase fold domain-containing protein [Paenibacillus sp. sgz500958]|uniref:alpha/beta hydrolase fold domain-containing protein n=1 Tax=Paenibacillus sp. sgz500958 TaxID=3242475 RepID=UPI0036D30D77